MAQILNLEIDQGASFSLQFELVDQNNQPVDLTGVTVRSQARKNYAASETVADFSLAAGHFVIGVSPDFDPLSGIIVLALTPAQTRAIPAGPFVYDVEVDYPGGQTQRLVEGQMAVRPEVTR